MPKVSAVIPVYNLEAYIGECLDSLVNQTLSDIEIICVDDGSTDGTGEVLRDYASRDKRVTAIRQEHAGVSVARNRGVEQATGEYLYFLDGDDYLALHALETLYVRATTDSLDVLHLDASPLFDSDELEAEHCGYKSYYRRKRDYPGVRSGQELLALMSENHDWKPAVWLQFIKADTYRELKLSFYEGIVHEDNLFSFLCGLQAERVGYVNEPLYQRRIRYNSIMTTQKDAENFRGLFVSYLEMLRFTFGQAYGERTSAAIARIAAEVCRQASNVYRGLPIEQREAVDLADKSPEALTTLELMRREAGESARTNATQRRLEEQADELQRLLTDSTAEFEGSISELRCELDKRTAELERMRSSRSYKLARALRRVLRRQK